VKEIAHMCDIRVNGTNNSNAPSRCHSILSAILSAVCLSCASVNVRLVYSGQSSLVLKQSSRNWSLICHRPVHFLGYPHEMGSTSGLSARYFKDFLVRNSMSFVWQDILVDFSSSIQAKLLVRMMI
jgi:hypothetical protein